MYLLRFVALLLQPALVETEPLIQEKLVTETFKAVQHRADTLVLKLVI